MVDDDVFVAGALCDFIQRSFPGEATAIAYDCAVDALDYLLTGADVALCFVDLDLGAGMSGRALIERAVAERPELGGRFVVCSGDPFAGRVPLPVRCRRLDKPFDLEELKLMVEGALGG